MSLSSELEVLVQLHAAGSLTDIEFEAAKAKLLSPDVPATKVSTASPLVQKSIRAKKDDNNPHPMRVVVSSMPILVAAAGLIFATMVPYQDNMPGKFKGNCSGPLFEMFQKGDYNPGYDPNYNAPINEDPSGAGKYDDFWDDAGPGPKYFDNRCIEPGKPRLITSLAVLIVSLVALGYLWRVEISDAISKHQNRK